MGKCRACSSTASGMASVGTKCPSPSATLSILTSSPTNSGSEAVRYYLVRDIVTGRDSNFDLDRLIMLFNTELANELGNLCNRALNMSQRFTAGILQHGAPLTDDDTALQASLAESIAAYQVAMDDYDVSKGLEALSRHIVHCNQYAERMKPWELNKDPEQKDRLATVLYHLAESVAHASVLLSPVLPDAAAKLAGQLNLPSLTITQAGRSEMGTAPRRARDRQTQADLPAHRRRGTGLTWRRFPTAKPLRGCLKNGRDRSPQRSCECEANGSAHEKLLNPSMVGHSLSIRRTARRSIPAFGYFSDSLSGQLPASGDQFGLS